MPTVPPAVEALFAGSDVMKTHLRAKKFLLLDEKGKGVSESWTRDNINLTYHVLIKREDRYLFLLDMLGHHKLDADGEIIRENPQPHWEFPWLVCAACDFVEGRGAVTTWNDDGRGIEWDTLVYRCTFAQPLFALTPHDPEAEDPGDGTIAYMSDAAVRALPGGEKNRFVERPRSRFEFAQLPLPGHFFRWAPGTTYAGGVIAQPLAIPSQVEVFSLIWRHVPTIPRAVINAHANAVNAEEWEGFEAECLLFAGAEVEPVANSPSVERLYNITYNFIYRAPAGRGISWNSYPVMTGEEAGNFEKIAGPDGQPPFRLKNFDGLFDVVPPA